MKKYFLFSAAILFVVSVKSQTGPWQSPLHIRTSANGIAFGSSTLFQDSSGVASIIRIGSATSDTLMAAFQWFPAPMFNPKWDKVAVKFSYNGGTTWTAPTSCTFTNLPGTFQRPFDPALVQLSSGQIRMYFSDGVNSPPPGGINTYSGLSNDGITYTFEPLPRFDDATKHAIDPSVAEFGGTYFYNAWTGVQTDGAYRAISSNGTTFTTQPMDPYDAVHMWLGNYLVDGSLFKFYGCGSPGIWLNSSTNGLTWTSYTVTNVMNGADPAVVKNLGGTYVMLSTGPPVATNVKENSVFEQSLQIFPNTFSTHLTVAVNSINEVLIIEIYDVLGKKIISATLQKGSFEIKINLSHLSSGTYNCRVTDGRNTCTRKIIKAD